MQEKIAQIFGNLKFKVKSMISKSQKSCYYSVRDYKTEKFCQIPSRQNFNFQKCKVFQNHSRVSTCLCMYILLLSKSAVNDLVKDSNKNNFNNYVSDEKCWYQQMWLLWRNVCPNPILCHIFEFCGVFSFSYVFWQ